MTEKTQTIVDRGYDFNFVDYMNPLNKQYADELNPYVIDFEKEGIKGVKGKIIFMFLKNRKGSYGLKSKNLSLSKYENEFFMGSRYETKKQRFLSQDGILIKEIERRDVRNILPRGIESDLIFFDVNLEDESKIDLIIDRKDVATSDKFKNLKRKIEKIIINHIERIFSQKHLVRDRDKYWFIERFFEIFLDSFSPLSDFFLERMKKLIFFKCSVDGETEYLTYDTLKDRWKFFYSLFLLYRTFHGNTAKDMKNAIEKAYSEGPIIYYERLGILSREFSGEHIIVTNKELGFSFDKYLLLSSVEKRDKKKKEKGVTVEGDYKDCFGTLTPGDYFIVLNINHPFVRLANKNRDTFRGEDKKDHEFFIEELLTVRKRDYLMPLKEIQRIQKHLIDFYMGKGVLSKEEAERYLLTEKDFCPYDMCEDFLK
jgi:hypothetical protein